MFILGIIPSIIWLSLKQIHSPWWLENSLSTPFTVLIIYSVLMLTLIHFVSSIQCVGYFFINFILAVLLNNNTSFNNVVTLNDKTCINPVSFFQFNIKYTQNKDGLDELIKYLIAGQYHLITLQGVSQQSKKYIIKKLSPYYPYFIRGENKHKDVVSDQLLFSKYAFTKIKYYEKSGNSFLISSVWQMPFSEVNLYSLHPPSPRNKKLWQTRNKTLYQLKHALKSSSVSKSIVIGDLNLSKHSGRIHILKQKMNTTFVNSWPKNGYVLPIIGLAIDHFWISKSAVICSRQRINKFSWSDHYAVKTQVDFK
jgi:hypothetical protein